MLSRVFGRRPLAEPYRLYRSHVNADLQDTMPGSRCVVIVTIDFDGSDEQRLRGWINAVVDALEAEPNAIPGMICGHFHASLAGNRVLNYAEWTSEQAYGRDAHQVSVNGTAIPMQPETQR
jgi:Antibiotic biosynthesis monooxygenase